MIKEKVRLDQYLFAIRIFKTRTLATKAISDGKVKMNGEDLKPSKPVNIGEVYNIRTPEKRLSIQVAQLIAKRVAYSLAILNYYDVSTDEDKAHSEQKLTSSFYTGKRLSNSGKPTKKQQRDLNDLLNNNSDE
jgi:ribosome-associated heat shock protein Hsp15